MVFGKFITSNKSRKIKRRAQRDKATIANSGFFDADWYLKKYPEIRNYRATPLDHYVEFGAAEGRAAGPNFDTLAYLTANPDVIAAGYNPLVHYIRHGEKEGRGFVSGPTHLVNQPEARQSKPITFSIIVNDGSKSDLKLTIKSILLCSEIFTEIVLPRDAKNYSGLIDTTSPGAKFCQFIYANGTCKIRTSSIGRRQSRITILFLFLAPEIP